MPNTMIRRVAAVTFAAAVLALVPATGRAQTTEPFSPGKVQNAPIPNEFIDPQTHLRVLHLSRLPTNYAGVVYFTYNTFSADSQLALFDTQYKDKWRYLYTFDFTLMAVKPLVTNQLTQSQDVAAKSGNVYYLAGNAAWVIPLKGGTPRKICDIPERWCPGVGFTVNADETLLLSASTDIDSSAAAALKPQQVRNGPNVLFTMNIKTGELKVIHRENHWIGHVQFSPTDPDLCMFCHEGNWEKVDRIWLINPSKSVINTTGNVTSNARLLFQRTEAREIAGHEFWRPDGKAIWFQHTYRARALNTQFLTAVDVTTGKTTDYFIPPGFGGIHQSFSPDGTFLISDGSGKTPTGLNKYLSRLSIPSDGTKELRGEHLVTLQANDYATEPNPHVSPDNHWVMFTATLHGTAQAYAVELPLSEKTQQRSADTAVLH